MNKDNIEKSDKESGGEDKVRKYQSAEERFPQFFEITDEVLDQLHAWIDVGKKPEIKTACDVIYLAFATRALNLYRSIVLLLEKDHWEDAAILTRSMFELLLNIEEIQRDKVTIEDKSILFFRFNKLQQYRQAKAIRQYNVDTGRINSKDNRFKEIDKIAELLFPDFLITTKKGKKKWCNSWCGKNIKELAEASEQQPLRKRQYDVLYSYMSAFTHSAPMSVMTTVGHLDSQKNEVVEKFWLEREENEETQLKLILSLSAFFVIEIILRVRGVLLDYDTTWNFKILTKLFKLYGVEPPPSPV